MKVTLKIKEGNTVENVQHEIEEINLKQFTDSLKVIKDVLKLTETDAKLQGFLNELANPVDYENEEVAEQILLQKLGMAFESLLVEVPTKGFELLAILSDIDIDVLMQQKLDDVFDIYDAVIKTNDLEKLVKRAKKSLEITQKRTSVMKLLNRKQTEQKQPS